MNSPILKYMHFRAKINSFTARIPSFTPPVWLKNTYSLCVSFVEVLLFYTGCTWLFSKRHVLFSKLGVTFSKLGWVFSKFNWVIAKANESKIAKSYQETQANNKIKLDRYKAIMVACKDCESFEQWKVIKSMYDSYNIDYPLDYEYHLKLSTAILNANKWGLGW